MIFCYRFAICHVFLLAAALLLIAAGGCAAASPTPEYWLGGEDPVTIRDKHRTAPADFMALFPPDSPWRRGASRVTAFKISMQFASRSSDDQLAAVIGSLRRRGISLALEMGMLRTDRGCGKGEGYLPPGLLDTAMRHIQRLGGTLDYVAMDEVVFFGHEKSWSDPPGQTPCQDTLPEIAREAAASAAAIHQYFPNAKIGAVEPVTTGNHLDVQKLVRDYLSFADLYAEASGGSLAFFHADIGWRSNNWIAGIAPLKAGLQSRGIRFGVIIGGDPDYKDDLSWTRAGLHQLMSLSASPATAPDDIVIQSWQPLPTRYLPETTPGTTTWMLLQSESVGQGP